MLRSKRAVAVNVQIMRTFVRLRLLLASNAELAKKLEELELKYDHQFKVVFDAIRQLMMPAEPKRKQIGFTKAKKRIESTPNPLRVGRIVSGIGSRGGGLGLRH